ncbi:MAG: ATP-dependent protease ATPase subunit HslU [bacterium]|jgi:ATP-dependent HslUV protease ATP-binding subunit HslU|nr:ATP-dependent protease ATPase subunit HslU [bacterium]MBK9473337.1 ATP-dependent protease ATPase subunit HslU [bacterium]
MQIRQIEHTSAWTCPQTVAMLDRYIIGQADAKKAVAIALRNRWRRMQLTGEARREVVPNNIILIGPTGVGKTEIARRLSQLADLPFLKVEATKFTEKGYVGRDVDSMVRDLVEAGIALVRRRAESRHTVEIDAAVEESLVDILFPPLAGMKDDPERQARWDRSREKIRSQLREGVLEDREVTVAGEQQRMPLANIFTSAGEEFDASIGESLRGMFPRQKTERRVPVAKARKLLREQEAEKRLDQDQITSEAIELVENGGIIFLDEIDKIAGGRGHSGGPDVSREGVQRDLLPIVEGSTVSTKYGPVKTDHVLFIAAGAFHMSKPSDLIPELQGRFPIRVELQSLDRADFVRILRDTEGSLIRQYQALLEVDGCRLTVTEDAMDELAGLAAELNKRMENIGARRLQTILAQLLDDVLYDVPESHRGDLAIDGAFVRERLGAIVRDEDLTRYIL